MIPRLIILSVIALAYLAPWPLLVNTAAQLRGDPSVYAIGMDPAAWAHHTLFLGVFLIVAAMVWKLDRWLSLIVVLAGAQTFLLGPHVTTIYLLIGICILMGARFFPSAWRDHAVHWIGISGFAQALMMLAQWWRELPAVGTFGITGVAACYVIMSGFLLPGWLLPVVAAAVVVSGTRAGMLAFMVALGFRYAKTLPATVLVVLLVVGGMIYMRPPSAQSRVDTWRTAIVDTVSSVPRTLVGVGLGRWVQYQPVTRLEMPHVYVNAHNDLVQWFYETGVLGLVLLAGWLVRWRRLALPHGSPVVPSLVAVSVMSLAWFPFHDLRTGILAALLVGVGTPLNEGA